MNKQELIKKAVEAFPVWPEGAGHIYENMHGILRSNKCVVDDDATICTREQHIRKRIELFEGAHYLAEFYTPKINHYLESHWVKKEGVWHTSRNGSPFTPIEGCPKTTLIPRPTPEELAYIAEIDSKTDTKKLIKLKPGHHVSTGCMTEEQYHAVCKAFIEAGAEKGEYGYSYVVWSDWEYVGWCCIDGIYHSNGRGYRIDEYGTYADETHLLKVDQVLGDTAVGTNTTPFVPEVGQECEYSRDGDNWYICKVLMYGNHTAFLKSHKADSNGLKEYSVPLCEIKFRPLKTEAEKERERLMEIGKKQIESCLNPHDDPHTYFECLRILIDAEWRP